MKANTAGTNHVDFAEDLSVLSTNIVFIAIN